MGLLDLFKKKEHREKYEKAERDLYRKNINLGIKKAMYSIRGPEERIAEAERDYTDYYSSTGYYLGKAQESHRKAQKKLKNLYAQGHKEALKLNKKYDALVAKLGKDAKEVYEFEEKELGMHKRDSAKKNIGTLVGVISVASLILASLLAVNLTGSVIREGGDVNTNSAIFLSIGFIFGIVWLIIRR